MAIRFLSQHRSYTLLALALPIQRNAAQVKNRCCCEQDIQRCPDKAEHLPVNPDVLNQLNGTERTSHNFPIAHQRNPLKKARDTMK